MTRFASGVRLFLAVGVLATGGAATSQNSTESQNSTGPVQLPAQQPPSQPQALPQQPRPQPPRRRPQPRQSTLPQIPSAPISALPEYPNCRDEYLLIVGSVRQANKVLSCISRLNSYDRYILQVFARRMDAYRESLRALWGQVNSGPHDFHQKEEFFARVSTEFRNSGAEGSYMDEYRATRGRYLSDRAFLRNEYCNLVTCPRRRR